MPVPAPVQVKDSAVQMRLDEILPDEISPKDALALLYELKSLAAKP
jgi:DNA mismatch repair protein MutS